MLTLPIKKKWFDMISEGRKKEEYRERSPFYKSRFEAHIGEELQLLLRNGYATTAPTLKATVLVTVGEGNPAWGAVPGCEYFVLKILKLEKVEQEIFALRARKCKRCGGILTSAKAVRNGFGHVCLMRTRAEQADKTVQLTMFDEEEK